MEIREFDYKKDSIIIIVNTILKDAIDNKASDIHFDTKEDGMLIKFRINGDLVLYSKIDDSHKKDILTRVKIMSGLNITNTSKFQSGNFVYNNEGHNINLRISCVPVINGEKIVIHISSFENAIPPIDELGFSENNLIKIKDLLNSNSGAVILVGGMGSGKNTTFYSILNSLDAEKNNVISIESNIKVKIDNVNQIKTDKNNIVNLINEALLLDPNIMLIDEIDSTDMVNAVLKIANSGGFIITTMQGKNGYDAINLLTNMKVENYLFSSSISGIVSQRLVKRLCPNCRTKRETNEYEKQLFNKLLGKNVKEIYEACGCKDCCNGYDRRIPIAEIITFDDTIKKALMNNKEQKNLRKIVYDKNDSLITDGLNRVINGETTLEEILNVIELSSDIDVKNLINSFQNEESPKNVDVKQEKDVKEETKKEEIKGDNKDVENKDNEVTKTVDSKKEDNVDKKVSNEKTAESKNEETDIKDEKKIEEAKENEQPEETKDKEDNENSEDIEGNKEENTEDSTKENVEDEFVINLKNDDADEEDSNTKETPTEDESKDEVDTSNDDVKTDAVVEEKDDKKKENKNNKKRPSIDNLSTKMGAFSDLKKPSYDDFDYDDMNAI